MTSLLTLDAQVLPESPWDSRRQIGFGQPTTAVVWLASCR